jgi:hypothetical protein
LLAAQIVAGHDAKADGDFQQTLKIKTFMNYRLNLSFSLTILSFFICAPVTFGQGMIRMTFDGTPTLLPGAGMLTTNYFESGMLFTPIQPTDWNEAFARTSSGSNYVNFYPDDGSTYVQALEGSTFMFSFTNGSAFGLVSVDLAEYSTVASDAVTVPFIGYQQDGSTVTNIFTTDGIIDGTGPLPDFQTFYFSGFTDVTRVEIPSYGWSLDNLVVSVPEPACNILLLLGMLALGAAKSRNRCRNKL